MKIKFIAGNVAVGLCLHESRASAVAHPHNEIQSSNTIPLGAGASCNVTIIETGISVVVFLEGDFLLLCILVGHRVMAIRQSGEQKL